MPYILIYLYLLAHTDCMSSITDVLYDALSLWIVYS